MNHWSFAVAIAVNLILVIGNLLLLKKINHWHRALRHTRQQLTLNERKIQTEVEQIIQNIEQVPVVTDSVMQKKQQISQVFQQIKLIQTVLKSFMMLQGKLTK